MKMRKTVVMMLLLQTAKRGSCFVSSGRPMSCRHAFAVGIVQAPVLHCDDSSITADCQHESSANRNMFHDASSAPSPQKFQNKTQLLTRLVVAFSPEQLDVQNIQDVDVVEMDENKMCVQARVREADVCLTVKVKFKFPRPCDNNMEECLLENMTQQYNVVEQRIQDAEDSAEQRIHKDTDNRWAYAEAHEKRVLRHGEPPPQGANLPAQHDNSAEQRKQRIHEDTDNNRWAYAEAHERGIVRQGGPPTQGLNLPVQYNSFAEQRIHEDTNTNRWAYAEAHERGIVRQGGAPPPSLPPQRNSFAQQRMRDMEDTNSSWEQTKFGSGSVHNGEQPPPPLSSPPPQRDTLAAQRIRAMEDTNNSWAQAKFGRGSVHKVGEPHPMNLPPWWINVMLLAEESNELVVLLNQDNFSDQRLALGRAAVKRTHQERQIPNVVQTSIMAVGASGMHLMVSGEQGESLQLSQPFPRRCWDKESLNNAVAQVIVQAMNGQ